MRKFSVKQVRMVAGILPLMLLLGGMLQAQLVPPSYPDSIFNTYYYQRVTHFRALPYTKGDILFVGNSITDGGEWSELFADPRVKNRGISGDYTAGVLNRLDEITRRKPAKVFLMIGVNDLSRNILPDSIVKNILLIAGLLRQESPATRVYVQSILPVNDGFGKFGGHTKKGPEIREVNRKLQQNAENHNYTFIDLYSDFVNADEKLKENLTNDGLHLKGEAYSLWKHLPYPYLNDAAQKAAVIPLPTQLQWQKGYFSLSACKSIQIKDSSLMEEALLLKSWLNRPDISISVGNHGVGNFIELSLNAKGFSGPSFEEAYRLDVSPSKLSIVAAQKHGLFYGLQTLRQLMRDGEFVDACTITDQPAFAWRGYMVDVGRNYQSTDLLKLQIDMMSRYKLNIFHFHLTEDIAWRLQSKLYPQLTQPENMLRNKGRFYTEADIRDLISYCQARHITLIPEIDMPGHSAAFTRAMKVDMQSDSGLAIVKNIIREFCETYDLPYLHIGGDEVKISNKNFLPEVLALVHSLGKKTIGWSPGGNVDDQTIRQLWMGDSGERDSSKLYTLDSRHLYLNHMDPLEAVNTLFFRQIGNKNSGTAFLKGAILCLWPDRRIENERDVLTMNPVFPGMLAFAERSWRGGGQKGWTAIIGDPGSERAKAFAEFEQRLLDQQHQNFSHLPFPYTRQSGLRWSLYGPYDNGGNFKAVFPPEANGFTAKDLKPDAEALGGTIVLRHWWAPLIEGWIKAPKENTTVYASTQIWSAEGGTEGFWIGFYNLSRSPATDSPPLGAWDVKGSAVWVNGQLIAPPNWQRGGQPGHPEIPLLDEGYEYRPATQITLKKGWNTVLVKAPIGSFKAYSWQTPAKWAFTFTPAPAAEQ